MVINLKGLINGDSKVIPVNAELDFTNEEYAGEKLLSKPVIVSGEIRNKADVTELLLNCDVVVNKPCDRCGVMTEKKFQIPINRVLVTNLEDEDNDNIDLLLLENEQLDLYEVCFSEILLALPMKHLCSEACKGVCPVCGKNLNKQSCNCETKSVDPRLEVLLQLLKDED